MPRRAATAGVEPFARGRTQTEHGIAGPALLFQVARLLARSPEPLTRTAILDELPEPPDEPRRWQMDGLGRLLHRFPAFHHAAPGHWQLGRTGTQIRPAVGIAVPSHTTCAPARQLQGASSALRSNRQYLWINGLSVSS
jgi:hypothetical protein